MRNPDPVQTKGQFWLPENPDDKLHGELCISEDGEIRLELFGIFSYAVLEGRVAMEDIFGPLKDFERICGYVKEGGSVTLLNCLRTSAQANLFSEHPLDSSSFEASIALVGACYGQDELSFRRFEFVVEGLDDWLETDTINLTVKAEVVDERIESFTGGTVDFSRKESRSFTLNDGVEVQFLSSVKSSPVYPSRPLSFLSLTSQPSISLVSEKPRDIDYFINLADKIRKFISLAVDQEVQFQAFTFLDEVSGQVKPIRMYLMTRLDRRGEYKSSVLKVLFSYSNVEEHLPELLNRWVENYEPGKIGHALNLYFSGAWEESSLLNANLVFLAQAIEVLHRSKFPGETPMDKNDYREIKKQLFECLPEDVPELIKTNIGQANRPSLRDRVTTMIEPFENWFRDNEKGEEFAERVSKTRNYFTHYSSELKKELRGGESLLNLYTKLEIVLLLHVLDFLGFDRSQLKRIVKGSRRLRQALDPSR